MVETLLYTLKPILDFIPEIQEPKQKIAVKDKLLWTAMTLFIYLVCSQIPLFGIFRTSDSDPLYWMRVILASNRSTLMELGISPLITSSMIVELIANSKMITYDPSVEIDRRLLGSAEKLLSFIVSFATAFVYVISGMYGSIQYIGTFKAMLLVIQLTFACVLVIYLDEVLQKGYGIGSGISLFIATNICENIFWRAFSPVTIKAENGIEFEGAIIACVHFLLTKQNKFTAIYLAFYRSNLANLHNIFATFFVFLIVIYFQGFQINLKLENRTVRGAITTFPIKLFYLSNTPIILQAALVQNLHMFSKVLYQRLKQFQIVKLLGQWRISPTTGREELVGGLTYYLVPPDGIRDFLIDPVHFILYILIVVISCGLFSRLWLEISGRSHIDILKQFHESNLTIAGMGKDVAVISQLRKYIPNAAIIGGMLIGMLSVFSDLIGTLGSGSGLLLMVNIIYGFFESYHKEIKGQKYISVFEF